MLAVTLRYLASASMFTNLQWGFRTAPNTISEVVQEVSQANVDRFWDKFIMTANTDVQQCSVAVAFCQQGIVTMFLGLLMGNMLLSRSIPSDFYNYMNFYSMIIMDVFDANYKFIWLNIGTNGEQVMPRYDDTTYISFFSYW